MNCRPGELAFIFGLHAALNLNDRPVQLANEPWFMFGGVPHWRLEQPIETTVSASGTNWFTGQYIPKGSTGVIYEVPDENLRPIRDPGEDAVDQMVLLMGAAPRTLTGVREVVHG